MSDKALAQWHLLCVRSPAFRRKSAQWSLRIPPEGGTTNEQHRQSRRHSSSDVGRKTRSLAFITRRV